MADEKGLVPEENQGEIVIYQTEDGSTKIDVRFEGETVWLTQQQMAELFGSSRTNIVEHIRHIYEEGELDEASTCRKFRQVRDIEVLTYDKIINDAKKRNKILFDKLGI